MIDLNNQLFARKYNYETETSAILGVGFKSKKVNVNLNGIFLQNSNNLVDQQRGFRDAGQTANDLFYSVNQQDISRFSNVQLLSEYKPSDRHTIKVGGSWINNHFQ